MLSPVRVIGHKEWTRRKSDPRHDMNWRRARVAAFTPRTAPEDDMDATQSKKLDDIHHELTHRFPSRVADSEVTETAVGYILNTDAATVRTERRLGGMASAINALSALVAEQNGLTLEDVRRVVAEEVAKGVDVDVTVQPGGPAA